MEKLIGKIFNRLVEMRNKLMHFFFPGTNDLRQNNTICFTHDQAYKNTGTNHSTNIANSMFLILVKPNKIRK